MEPTSILIPISKQSQKSCEGWQLNTMFLSSVRLRQLEADIRTATWVWKIHQNPLDSQPQLILCLQLSPPKNWLSSIKLWLNSLRIDMLIPGIIVGLLLGLIVPR